MQCLLLQTGRDAVLLLRAPAVKRGESSTANENVLPDITAAVPHWSVKITSLHAMQKVTASENKIRRTGHDMVIEGL